MQKTFLILLVFILFSCNNNGTGDGFLTTKSNFEYKIIPSAEGGDTIQKGDIVKVHLIQYIDDSLLNDTHKSMPEYIKIDSTLRNFDFSEILPLMKVNDSAVCRFSTKEILKRSAAETHPPHFFENRKYIYVYFKVIGKFGSDSLGVTDFGIEEKRFNDNIALAEKAGFDQAEKSFAAFIGEIKTPLIALSNGVFVQVMRKGNGNKIRQGDSVAVVYEGRLLNGVLFEKTTVEKPYIVRAAEWQTIEGFDTGIASLEFGDKAKIFVPARLAYGANKAGENIPAFSNLIFDVSVNHPR